MVLRRTPGIPFTKKVRAQNVATSIKTYGEELFKQIFGDPDIYAEYRSLLKSGLNDLQIEIAGSPRFHALHWEVLKDPKLEQPIALQAAMMRKNLQPQALPSSIRPSPVINLLIVTAGPSGVHDVGYRTISRPLVEALRNANLRVQIEILRPGTYKALENHLRDVTAKHGEGYYHVIHFDAHGAVLTYDQFQLSQKAPAGSPIMYKRYARNEIQPYKGVKAFLSFKGDSDEQENNSDLVEASKLASLLVKHHIPITILNACQSGKQIGDRETSLGSHLIQAGLQLVLAMGYSVTVSTSSPVMISLLLSVTHAPNSTITKSDEPTLTRKSTWKTGSPPLSTRTNPSPYSLVSLPQRREPPGLNAKQKRNATLHLIHNTVLSVETSTSSR